MLQGIGGGIILAIVNFLMVFLVLGGLAGVLFGLKRALALWERRQELKAASSSELAADQASLQEAAAQTHHTKQHLAAITAALHEFTAQPAGTLRIDSVEPLEETPVSQNQAGAVISAAMHQYLTTPTGSFVIDSVTPVHGGAPPTTAMYAAISAALHEYLATPDGTFRIVRIQSAAPMNTWKMAGRFDALGLDTN